MQESSDSNKLKSAFERLHTDYDGAGKDPYEVITHPYFSTGAWRFQVVNSVVDSAGFTRLVLKVPAGSKIDLFGYGLEDNGQGAGLSPAFAATDAETNIVTRHFTNNEDFAIEGISLTGRGVRVSYPDIGADIFTDPELHSAIQNGDVTIFDPAATIVPPEISSPLALQDTLLSALRGKVSLEITFDRKSEDHVARMDKFPEGGANTYLMANGEPSHHNFFRLHEGYVWRASQAKTDKILSIIMTVQDDCYVFVTLPTLYQPTTPPASILGDLLYLWWEFTVFLHGRAFYIPSKNI